MLERGIVMNFYDKVHELVRTFKETDEYKNYIDIKKKIKANEEIAVKLKDFKAKQQQEQINYINNGKMNEDSQKALENMYSILIQNDDVRRFFEAEIKLDVLLADMQKIMGEGIKEMVDFE